MGNLVVSLVKGATNAVKFTKSVPKSSGSLSQALTSGVGKTANVVAKNTDSPVRSLDEIHNANVKLNAWLGKIFKKSGLSKDVSGEDVVNKCLSNLIE